MVRRHRDCHGSGGLQLNEEERHADLRTHVSFVRTETGDSLRALRSQPSPGARGPKCLLIHGNPGCIEDWNALIPRLVEFAEVTAIDLPGFGESERRGETIDAVSLDAYADVVAEALVALGWHDPVVLVGHSHGCGVATTMAAKYPSRVAALVLLGSLGYPEHLNYRLLPLRAAAWVVGALQQALRAWWLRGFNRRVLRRILGPICSPERVPSQLLDAEFDLLSRRPTILCTMLDVTHGAPCFHVEQAIRSITCPTLFIHGARDAVVPLALARNLYAARRCVNGAAEFQDLPDAGHLLIHFQAAEIAQRVSRFLG